MDNDKQVAGSSRESRLGIGRRELLIKTALAGAMLPVASSVWAASSDQIQGSSSMLQTGESQMKTRKLGTLAVSEVGAGCMSISANYGPPADIESRR